MWACLCVCMTRGSWEGFLLWVMCMCVISLVGECSPTISQSLMWHALWKREEGSSEDWIYKANAGSCALVLEHIIAEHGCEWWIVLGVFKWQLERTYSMSLYKQPPPSHRFFWAALTLQLNALWASIAPILHTILHYTVISSSVLSHHARVCSDSTVAIYMFLQIAIRANLHDCSASLSSCLLIPVQKIWSEKSLQSEIPFCFLFFCQLCVLIMLSLHETSLIDSHTCATAELILKCKIKWYKGFALIKCRCLTVVKGIHLCNVWKCFQNSNNLAGSTWDL